MTRPTYRRALAVCALIAVTAAIPFVSAARSLDLAGPTSPTGQYDNGAVLPDGRLVTPAGRTFDVGDFPLGVAVSPDGRLAVAINSGQGSGLNSGYDSYCTSFGHDRPCPYKNPGATPALTATAGVSTTRAADESLSVVDLRTGGVREVKAVPTSYDPVHPRFNFFYVGVTFSPDGQHLYAAGGGNDAIYDFPVRRDVVASAPIRTVTLPSSVGSANNSTAGTGYTKGIAVTPDGRYLLVAHELNDTLDVVDTRTYAVQQLSFGPPSEAGDYPYGVAVSPDGATAYVSLQGVGQVARVLIAGGTPVLAGTIAVGDHPTGIATSPDGSRVYVANADSDTLSIISATGATGPAVAATVTLHAFPGEQLGSAPNAVTVSPDGQRVYVALAGDDAVAELGTAESFSSAATGAGPRRASPAPTDMVVGGLIPTGWYPSGVATSPDGRQVYIASAKGLGSRTLGPGGVNLGAAITSSFTYDANNMPGILQSVPAPSSQTLLSGVATARANLRFATNADAGRGPNNPIPPASITGTTPMTSPIKYVIEIVRENRTFDQELGDIAVNEGRTAPATYTVNADPNDTIFGRDVTPNAHALVGDVAPTTTVTATSPLSEPAYATSDNFYSDGEASIQGHWWTAAATVNDYVEKSWRDYYSPRNHPFDPTAPIASPPNCSIFQSAQAKASATAASLSPFTYRDYGELVGLVTTPGGGASNPCSVTPASPNFDATGSNNATLVQDNRPTASAFLTSIGLNADGSPSTTANPATAYLRNFSYVILGEDHTSGLATAGNPSPRACLAQNDAGLGMIIAALSRSKYWPQTAVFVMEDDSQDGLDHVDGHRNMLYVISPYAKHVGPDGKPGYVGHLHYDQAGVLKTIETILGLPYLSTYDQNASPLYDLFQDKNDPSQLTPQDLAPYTVQPAPSFINETAAQVIAGANASSASPALASAVDVAAAESRHLNLSGIDRAGPMLEIVDWQLARPGQPLPAALLAEEQAWLARHGGHDGD